MPTGEGNGDQGGIEALRHDLKRLYDISVFTSCRRNGGKPAAESIQQSLCDEHSLSLLYETAMREPPVRVFNVFINSGEAEPGNKASHCAAKNSNHRTSVCRVTPHGFSGADGIKQAQSFTPDERESLCLLHVQTKEPCPQWKMERSLFAPPQRCPGAPILQQS